ncbi:MAG TPA: hypothetical protein DD658_00140 [Deltaproteobacteria bacterium]|nr:MAG: hypothetical protein A2X88_06410 [Deltaproteobacteria bacterium GWC2_65_14]HBO68641.1 hypothetical protein [Deltaproteobacteria bacterium]
MESMPDPKTALSRLCAGPFPALENALLSRIPAEFGRDPGTEHVLLVPSNELREHLLRRLASRWEGSAAGASILTLYDFALRLLKHRGLFLEELPPARYAAALSAAVRETYGDGGGDFTGISTTRGFLPALSRTLSDLEEGWVGDGSLRAGQRKALAEGRAEKAARWAEWRRLAAAVERKVRALGGMTRRRIFQEAVAGFEQPGYPFRVTLYGFYDFTRLQWTLVDALLSSGLLDEIYFPGTFSGDGVLDPAFAYAARSWDRLLRAFEGNVTLLEDAASPDVRAVRENLFSPGPPADPPVPVPFSILSAPHEEGEIRLAARTVRRWLDADPEGEILLVSRRFAEEAVPIWERIAAEYGIRAAGRLHVPLASTPPVQLLVRMLESAQENFPRRAVIEILSSPYRRRREEETGPAPRPDLWEVWTRERLVVGGDDWETRMAVPDRREEEEGEEREEHRIQMALLREEVRSLREILRPYHEARGYAGFAAAVRDLLLGEFRIPDDGTAEAERDRRACLALLELLGDIGRIPPGEVPWPPPEGALPWFFTLLSEQRLFLGERGGMRVPGAVVAGDLLSLRGVTADRILFLSVNEELVPAQLEEDPLLPDEDREELNRLLRRPDLPDALSLRRRNAAEEKLLFSLPSASAREEIAHGVLRADASGNARRPSRYLLLLLSRFAGPGVFSEGWAKRSGAPLLELPRSPLAALEGPAPLSGKEKALARWRSGLAPEGDPEGIPWRRIAPALAALAGRERGLALFPDAWRRIPPPDAFSASALDELAACPYRFFLHRMAGIVPVEDPEEIFSLTPAEEGRILHDVLRSLGEEAGRGGGWPDPGPASAKAFSRFARGNPTGLPGLYRIRCREIEADVGSFVSWERGRADSSGGTRVEAVERRFVTPGGEGLPPFRGRVDRIDRGPRGEAAIVDYKYRDGKNEKIPLERIRCGLSHQIPVYLEFARTLSPDVRATLLFLKREVREVTLDGPGWEKVREEWAGTLRAWTELLSEGYFPPLPHHRFSFAGKAPPRYCDSCPYRDPCRVSPAFTGTRREAEALAGRLATDPAFRRVARFRPPRGE